MLTSRVDSPETLPAGTCRRYGTRFIPVRLDACLAWWEEPGDIERTASPSIDEPFADLDPEATAELSSIWMPVEPEPSRTYALLLDISLHGASVAVDRVPPPDRSVYFSLVGDVADAWVEAEVVGRTITRRGPHLVRLSFPFPCGFETIRGATCG